MENKPKIIDLFSGCGGFGLGAELAGFHVELAVDIDPILQSAYKLNFPNTRTITGDIFTLNTDGWKVLTKNSDIDGVIGGPPCQGYSRIGKNNFNDPRRSLIYEFYKAIKIISPKFFIMENVEGLMDKRNKGELLKAIDIVSDEYTVLEPMIIDASEFGAATKRKRVIVVGYKKGSMNMTIDSFKPNFNATNVKEAIWDISKPIDQNKDKLDFGWSRYRRVKNISEYAQKMRQLPPKGLGSTDAINNLKKGIVSGHFDTVHSQRIKDRFEATPMGMTESISRCKKLDWNGLCPTLRAGTGSDKGSHQAVRPIHPTDNRVITVREAARLQGFPDWFCFHPTKWHSFRMIGNSVSPIASKAILGIIKDNIEFNGASFEQERENATNISKVWH